MSLSLNFFQFFAHPVINNLMTEKWHGELGSMKRHSWLTMERWAWGFLNVWCFFDLVLFPLLFVLFGAYHFVRKKIRNRGGDITILIQQFGSDLWESGHHHHNVPGYSMTQKKQSRPTANQYPWPFFSILVLLHSRIFIFSAVGPSALALQE